MFLLEKSTLFDLLALPALLGYLGVHGASLYYFRLPD